jgi:hypothetical protein
MKAARLKLFLCLAFFTSFAYAQPPDASKQSSTDNAKKESQATVYVYRYKQFVGSALSPSVYCDEVELAKMQNGRFFVAKLPAGKHAFRSNDKQSGVEVELKPGLEYYIRVEIAAGMMKGHGRVTLVAAEQGVYEVKKLKPLDADKVKDNQRVIAANFERSH